MMKFFRKHNRKLLAVSMAGLLIVWLGGSALDSLMAPSDADRLVASSKLGPIEQLDLQRANFETDLLVGLGLNWRRPWPLLGGGDTDQLEIVDWILLTRESERYGIVVRELEVDRFLAARGITPNDLRAMASQRDVKASSIRSATAQLVAVQRLIDIVATSSLRSEAQVRLAARDQTEKVRVNLVSLRASLFSDEGGTHSAEEIQAHFEKYKSRKRQHPRGIDFGYFQPPEVKVEYFMVDVDEIAANLRIGDKTLESKARSFWRDNRQNFMFRRPPDTSTEDQQDQQTVPPPKPKSPYFEDFEEARQIALEAVRQQFAAERAEKISEWLVGQLSEPWYNAAEGEDGYKIAPEAVLQSDYFGSVLERLPRTLQFGDAVRIEVTDSIKEGDAYRVANIGSSALQLPGGGRRPFPNLAFQTQGITPLPSAPRVDTSFYLATGQSCPMPLTGGKGGQYVYRIIDAKPAASAESLEQVRDQVFEDLDLIRGFARAQEVGGKLAAQAASTGLEAAFNADEELKAKIKAPSGFYVPQPFSRRFPGTFGSNREAYQFVTGVGRVDASFVEQCMELADKPEGRRIGMILMEELGSVVVVEWLETIPLRSDEYAQKRAQLSAQLNQFAMAEAVDEWLNPDRIRVRNNFAFAQR